MRASLRACRDCRRKTGRPERAGWGTPRRLVFPSPTQAALARARVQACGEGIGVGVASQRASAAAFYLFASQLPSPVPGEDAERRRRSAGEGPRRRRALFRDRDDKPPRYSGGGGRSPLRSFHTSACFLPIAQPLVEIGPHRLAVERDHHRLPRPTLRRPHGGEHVGQPVAHVPRVGDVSVRRGFSASEQVGLRLGSKRTTSYSSGDLRSIGRLH